MFEMMMILAEYAAPDGSFKIRVPEGWRGLTMIFVEPSNGGEERIVMGAGILPFSAQSLFDTEWPERMELVLSGESLRDVHTMRVPARLVASLWKMDDRATAESMKEYYAGFLRDGRRKPDGSIRNIGRGLYCRGSGDIWLQFRGAAGGVGRGPGGAGGVCVG